MTHPTEPVPEPQPRSLAVGLIRREHLLVRGLIGLLLAYLLVAYWLLPAAWEAYARRHPALENVPGITHTGAGIPGDPINLALIGDKAELVRAMLTTGWHLADPLSMRSSLEIAAATMLERPYADAPVSNLFLWNRKEDLAFEQQVGADPRERHHVRFWQSAERDAAGRPAWAGAATFDRSVGLSHTTGQITHHIGPDIDAERDRILDSLERAGLLAERFMRPGFHQARTGRNGGGDPWHTDGALGVGVLKAR